MLQANAMSAGPTFSVIVACKNPGARLAAALASVWNQRGVALELIVIDGASSDGSREWLEARRDKIATFESQPDRGVYAAMNRGITLARGAWVYFLGADDRLADEQVLSAAASETRSGAAAGVLVGEVVYDDGRVYAPRARGHPIARNFVHHQGAFYPRRLFAEQGLLDSSLAVMADYELNLRPWKRGVAFTPIPRRIAVCGSGGLSDGGRWQGYREEILVRHRYFSALHSLPWDALSVARFLRKRLLRRGRRSRT